MNEEESMSASFRAMIKLHAYRELTGEEESFFELYPEFIVKKRIAKAIGGHVKEEGLDSEVREMGEKIRAGGYSEPSIVQRLEEELRTLREGRGVIAKGVEKVLDLSSSWVTDILDKKEFTLSDLNQMHKEAPEKYKPMISESMSYLTRKEEAGSTIDPKIQRLIS